MSRGGYREKSGRKSGWNHADTKTIRVPMVFADRLLEIAHALDSGEVIDSVTKSIDSVTQSKQSVTEPNRKVDSVSKSKSDNVTKSMDSVTRSNQVCPNCGSEDWGVEGYRTVKSGQRKQKRKCKRCDRIWSVAIE